MGIDLRWIPHVFIESRENYSIKNRFIFNFRIFFILIIQLPVAHLIILMKPVDGKYNTIYQKVGDVYVWINDTWTICSEPDAEAQSATDDLVYNKCLKWEYTFISINKYSSKNWMKGEMQ